MVIYPEIGQYTSWGYVMYRAVELRGPRAAACRMCDLPLGVCDGPMPIRCRPEQRTDGKQVIFKKKYNIKKRDRRISQTNKTT